MGIEIRRVPTNWQHPKDDQDEFIPMHEHFTYDPEEVEEGLRDGWLHGDPPHYDVPVVDYNGAEQTHYQMYETVTEGTPVSPVFATKDELVEYLVTHGDSFEGNGHTVPWAREHAEHFVKAKWAPSFVITIPKEQK